MTADRTVPDFPREIVPGLHWIGKCTGGAEVKGQMIHVHLSTYLIVGESGRLLVDTGVHGAWPYIDAQIQDILGSTPLDYVFPTHAEGPHMANLLRLHGRYPAMKVIGNLKSYQLYYPTLPPELLVDVRAGATLDLGDTELVFLDAAIRDLPDTLWVYDPKRRAMFVSDALGFYHYHDEGQCALSVEELPEQPTRQQVALLNEQALYWARYTDFRLPFKRLDQLIEEHPVDLILPAHGNIVLEPATTVPAIREQLIASVDDIAIGVRKLGE